MYIYYWISYLSAALKDMKLLYQVTTNVKPLLLTKTISVC